MSRKSDFLAWVNSHQRKRRYPTRRAAERKRWWLMITRFRFGLHSYPCRWTSVRADGPYAGPEHWHLGHRRKTSRTWLRVYVIWPYYRARRWWRKLRTDTLTG